MAIIMSWSHNPAPEGKEHFYTYDRVGRGWHSLLDKIFEVLSEEAVVVQVKEKFGGLRFYTMNTTEEEDKVIRWAESESFKICEVCGKPGKCDTINDWRQTLCDKHRKEVEDGKKKWMYREEERN